MKSDVPIAIGGNLKEARRRVKLTQQQVAEEVSRSRQTISAWENGDSLPSLEEFRELAILYVTSADMLLFGIKTAPTGGRLLEDIFRERATAAAEWPFGL